MRTGALGAAQVLSAARCFNSRCVVTFPGQLVFPSPPHPQQLLLQRSRCTTHNAQLAESCRLLSRSHGPWCAHMSYLVDVYRRSWLHSWNQGPHAGVEDPNDGRWADACLAPRSWKCDRRDRNSLKKSTVFSKHVITTRLSSGQETAWSCQ